MTLDAVRASIFVVDIIGELSKSTEVVPVVEGYSGVIKSWRRSRVTEMHTVQW